MTIPIDENFKPYGIRLTNGNMKLVDDDKYIFLQFNLLSSVTCPYATESCRKKCYANKAERIYKNTRQSRTSNCTESKGKHFVNDMIAHISLELIKTRRTKQKIIFRIHESGDFYSKAYFRKWVEITNHFKGNKNIIFQAYTKSLPYLKGEILEEINIKFVFSIWDDTDKKQIALSEKLGLTTFKAVVETKTVKDAYICKGKCQTCKECYIGKEKNIVVKIH